MESPPTGVPNGGGLGYNWQFSTNILLYVGISARWNAVRNSYVLYRMVLFPVTLNDPIYQNHTIFDILCRFLYFIVSGDRDFEFGW